MFEFSVAFMVFSLTMVLDMLYGAYTVATSRLKPLKASITGSAIYGLNSLVVFSYTQNLWYVIPAVLGAFCGTYIIVSYEAYKNKKMLS